MPDMRLAAVAEAFRRLREANPHPTTELEYASPFQLLVAVVLLLVMARALRNTATTNETRENVEASAIFWHLCDLVWLLLLPVVYLLR